MPGKFLSEDKKVLLRELFIRNAPAGVRITAEELNAMFANVEKEVASLSPLEVRDRLAACERDLKKAKKASTRTPLFQMLNNFRENYVPFPVIPYPHLTTYFACLVLTRSIIDKISTLSLNELNQQDADGCSALHITMRLHNVHIVRALDEAGIDLEIENYKGMTALAIALNELSMMVWSQPDYTDAIKYLVTTAGASVKCLDEKQLAQLTRLKNNNWQPPINSMYKKMPHLSLNNGQVDKLAKKTSIAFETMSDLPLFSYSGKKDYSNILNFFPILKNLKWIKYQRKDQSESGMWSEVASRHISKVQSYLDRNQFKPRFDRTTENNPQNIIVVSDELKARMNDRLNDSVNKIQKAYRHYRSLKQRSVTKSWLLPTGELPKTLPVDYQFTHSKLIKELFSDTESNQTFLFRKAGVETLFSKKDNKYSVNLRLAQYYLNKGEEIRPWILEAYLKGKVSQSTFLTLFEIQEAVSDYWQNLAQLKRVNPVNIFPVHKDGILTSQSLNLLAPFIMRLINASKDMDTGLDKELLQRLVSLPEIENYYTFLELPSDQINILAFFTCNYILYGENPFNPNKFNKNNLSNFLEYIAKKCDVIFNGLDAENFKEQVTALNQALIPIVFSYLDEEKLALVKKMGQEYKDEKEKLLDLFTVIVNETQDSTGEYTPVILFDTISKTEKIGIIILGEHLQRIWLNVLTNQDPREVLSKVPKFSRADLGVNSLEVKNRLSSTGQSLISLNYPGIESSERIHRSKARQHGLYIHDNSFHYENLFFIKSKNTLYKIHQLNIKVIQDVTGHISPYLLIKILDYARSYQPSHHFASVNAKLDFWLSFGRDKNRELAAMAEYIFIIISHFFKNIPLYCNLLSKSTNNVVLEREALRLLSRHIFPVETLYEMDQWLDDTEELQAELKSYSHSVGALMLTLLLHQKKWGLNCTFDDIRFLGEQLHQLEEKGLIHFIWNKKDGMMLDINEQSFRFRKPRDIAKPQMDDHRYDRTYANEKVRLFSSEPGWLLTLQTAVSELQEQSLRNKY